MRSFMTNSLFAFASCGITAGLVAFSAPAIAADVDNGPRQMTVDTGDLNLAAPAGRTVAERRIRSAAAQVCSTGVDPFPVDSRCRAEAIDKADHALDARASDGVAIASN